MNQREFYLYKGHEADFQKQAQRKLVVKKKLKALVLKDAYLLPLVNLRKDGVGYGVGGVVDNQGNYVESSGRYRGKDGKELTCAMVGAYPFKKEKCPVIEGECIYCGDWLEHYGHFLCEGTTRLWYAVDHYKKGMKLIFLSETPQKISGNFKRFFELFGIDIKDILFVTDVSLCRHLVVPDVSSLFCEWATKEFYLPFKKISDSIEAKNCSKIYLSRGHFKSRSVIGEESVEKFFKENGFKVIYPEELSLKELISYLKGAEYVAGLSGTGLHNMLFASPKSKLIILNRSNFFNIPQEMINQLLELDVFYVDANYNYLGSQWSVFFIGLTDPMKRLAKRLSFKISEVSPLSLDQITLYFKEYMKKIKTERGLNTVDPALGQIWTDILTNLELSPKKYSAVKFKYSLFTKFTWGKLKKRFQKKHFNIKEKR